MVKGLENAQLSRPQEYRCRYYVSIYDIAICLGTDKELANWILD